MQGYVRSILSLLVWTLGVRLLHVAVLNGGLLKCVVFVAAKIVQWLLLLLFFAANCERGADLDGDDLW